MTQFFVQGFSTTEAIPETFTEIPLNTSTIVFNIALGCTGPFMIFMVVDGSKTDSALDYVVTNGADFTLGFVLEGRLGDRIKN